MSLYVSPQNPRPVLERSATWLDATRGRSLAVRIFRPTGTVGRRPLVAFSPGLGASCDQYLYLLRYWAARGYVCVSVTHPGTDCALWRGRQRPWPTMAGALDDPVHRVDRPRDLAFVLDRVAADATLRPLVDYGRQAVAGHSYGAFTALALAGLHYDGPDGPEHAVDGRVRCVVVMSPQGPGQFGQHAHSWDDVRVPVMSLTGTQDRAARTRDVRERFTAYRRVRVPGQYLAVIRRANHYAFGDGPGIGLRPPPRQPHHHHLIQVLTTAFLDAHLSGLDAAQAWLRGGAAAAALAGEVRLMWR